MPNNIKPAINIAIWHIAPESVTQPQCIATLKTWLSSDETARMVRLHQPQHQHAFLISHALKRGALARILNVHPATLIFGVGSHGRPFLMRQPDQIDLQFNLSHTKGMAAIAVSQNACIGLDVESLNRKGPDTEFAARMFTPPEYQDILEQAPERQRHRLLEYWTLKEAYIKAEGLGISIGLDTFNFRICSSEPSFHLHANAREPSHAWRFKQLNPTTSHLMALAWAPLKPYDLETVKNIGLKQTVNNRLAYFDLNVADWLNF